MANNTVKRVNKLHNRFVITLTTLHLIIGSLGYISSLDNTPDIILYRKSYNGKFDGMMFAAQCGMSIFIFFSISINIKPGRMLINQWLVGTEEARPFVHTLTTMLFVVLPGLIGMVYPDVLNVYSVLAGYIGILFQVTFPGFCYIKCNDLPFKHSKNIAIFLATCFFTLVGFTGATISILDSFGVINIK